MAALQAATRNAARYLDRADSGTVETGKVADLVLLDGDPLDDIHNTQRIGGVTMAGRYYPRAELDRMLSRVEAIARQ
jgi:imidazolonepropionase-like amidohydrolase